MGFYLQDRLTHETQLLILFPGPTTLPSWRTSPTRCPPACQRAARPQQAPTATREPRYISFPSNWRLIIYKVPVSIQDTFYALYTIQHLEPHPKYYKYYIVLNFLLYPPICVKKCKIMPKNHVKSRAISNFSQLLPIFTNAKITSSYFCFMYAAFGKPFYP